MTPESAGYLARAHQDLDDAHRIMRISLANVAARSAYYAAFHAAEAVIFEKTKRIAKTHKGVRTEFARLSRDDARFPGAMTGFLAKAIITKKLAITASILMRLSRCKMRTMRYVEPKNLYAGWKRP